VLPRTLAYSDFAARLAEGDDSPMEEPTGSDEISQLGHVLQDLAGRGRTRRLYEQSQLEFSETLQLTADESEAHGVLRRHLERSIRATQVTVLNRNNSADRLEAVTPVNAGSPLHIGLEGAKPRSCHAARQARTYRRAAGSDPLVSCQVCGDCSAPSTCTPLLVSGEVIGSVLALHQEPLNGDEANRIRESVAQAAPVLSNLRNLAIAELRASTDGLTGLPNKRAVADNLKQMVAQALRTETTLAMLMLDLDHFKQINDRFGHGRGDEVLAAVGAALRAVLRDADFVGRYGGEEFVALLPGVSIEGALVAAEKIRSTFADIFVAELDRPVTVSIGIAMIPDHGGDPGTIERAADNALYAAKRNGRNRVEIAGGWTDAPELSLTPNGVRPGEQGEGPAAP
jgi:diguanylate cyclase (GGDEF)-like protein